MHCRLSGLRDRYSDKETQKEGRHEQVAALDDGDVTFDDDALRKIASDYTREAGVRQLER